jgi:16S rRNA (guanine966-N2)-methyltransferase
LGIEALSRGAAHCTFVERDRTALRTLRENLETLDLSDRARVVPGDAMVLSRGIDADLVLADPPYGFEQWSELLDRISAPRVVAESGRESPMVAGWTIVRAKRYGRSWVTFYERADDPGIIADTEQRQ